MSTRLASHVALLAFALVLCEGCGGGGSSNRGAAPGTIGPGGGTLASQGTTLTVPAGALTQTITPSIQPGTRVATGAVVEAGPAVLVGPVGAAFSTPATLTLAFDPLSIQAAGKMTGDLVVLQRDDSTGTITTLQVASVDVTNNTVTVQVSTLGTFQPAVPATIDAAQSTVAVNPSAVASDGVQTATITVTVRNTRNGVVPGATVLLTATGSSNTLVQPTGVTNAQGVATGSLASTAVETKTISATVNQVSIAQQATVTFVPPSSRLTFGTQPTTVGVGASLPTINVRVEDGGGNLVTALSLNVTLTASHPAGTPLGGTTSVQSVNGVASFPGLTLAQPGTAVTLVASSSGLTGATSNAFDVTTTVPAGAGRIYAITATNQLVAYPPTGALDPLSSVAVTGLQGGEAVVGIDFRPATGQLFGLGSTGRLYTIDRVTAVAAQVGAAFSLNGTAFGLDFNPVVDRVRVVSDADQNLRLVPTTAVVTVDGNLAYAAGDVNAPANPSVVASAYTNSFAGTTTTTLYGIDSDLDVLVIQSPPNAGALVTVGTLGVDTSQVSGFDIVGADRAYALLSVGTTRQLRMIDLATGAATFVGAFAEAVIDIAVEPPAIVALTNTNAVLTFGSARPGTLSTAVRLSGLQAGESALALDYRPATNELFALGSTSRLYRLDAATGVATPAGGVFGTTLVGTAFGFDFDPTTDRVVVVSDTGQNLNINPTSGLATASMPLASGIVGLAATQDSTFYGIDSMLDRLVTVDTGSGAVTTVAPLGSDVDTNVAFDIASDGVAYAAARPAGMSGHQLRLINLTTGASTIALAVGSPLPIVGLTTPVLSAPAGYGLTTGNGLVVFDLASGVVRSTGAVTNLAVGDTLAAIDVRPATGQLYGIGLNATNTVAHIYTINRATRVATQLAGIIVLPQAAGAGTSADVGLDFNPVVDAIRVVNTGRDNFRVNATTGSVAGADTILTPVGSMVTGAAYANNVAGAASTTLYGIDVGSNPDQLVVQGGSPVPPGASPNGGVLTVVGPLGVDSSSSAGGFDLRRGLAYAALTVGGASGVYSVNLTTGSAMLLYGVPGGVAFTGLALDP